MDFSLFSFFIGQPEIGDQTHWLLWARQGFLLRASNTEACCKGGDDNWMKYRFEWKLLSVPQTSAGWWLSAPGPPPEGLPGEKKTACLNSFKLGFLPRNSASHSGQESLAAPDQSYFGMAKCLCAIFFFVYKSGSIKFFKPLHTLHACTHVHTHAHIDILEKTKERKGALSALITRRRCVLEAVQGSTVIGLFSYWGIQSRTEGYGSEQSDPRIPPPAFHPFLLPSLSSPSSCSSNHPPLPPHSLSHAC